MTGRHLREGGSSRTAAAAAAVPAQRLVLSPARLNLAPLHPTLLQQPIQEFVEKLEGSDVIPTNHNCRAEAAQALSNDVSRSNGWQDTIDETFQKPTGITVKFFLQILAANFVQCGHHTAISQKVLLNNCWETRMIWLNVHFPLFYERQRWRFLYFLQQAVYKSSQLSKSVVTLICCSGGKNEIIGNWNKNMYHRQGNTDNNHPWPAMTTNFHPHANVERWSNKTSVFLGNEQRVSRNHYEPTEHKKAIHWTVYRFQEEDAADGTSFAPSDPSRSTRQFPSSETEHSTINTGTKMHQHDQKRKTLPQGYRHHLCAPSPSKKRQLRATRQWCWLQHQQDEAYPSRWSGWPFSERGERTSIHVPQHPSADWRWSQSSRARPSYQTHWKLSAVNTGEKGEDQELGSQSVFDGTQCPNIRRRLPRGRSNHQRLTLPTRQAPKQPLPDPMLSLPDEDRCCSDPAWPHKLSWRYLCPTCKETPAPCRLPPQSLHRSFRVISPS